jgi:osmoprotectant transport system substrate-binding protein
VPLVDDRHLQNAEHLTPVIRSEQLDSEVRRALDEVSAQLTSDDVTTLVGRVAIGGEDITSVARGFLAANDLV